MTPLQVPLKHEFFQRPLCCSRPSNHTKSDSLKTKTKKKTSLYCVSPSGLNTAHRGLSVHRSSSDSKSSWLLAVGGCFDFLIVNLSH
jgi:hypothetical protein